MSRYLYSANVSGSRCLYVQYKPNYVNNKSQSGYVYGSSVVLSWQGKNILGA